jgi:hypothetical protein
MELTQKTVASLGGPLYQVWNAIGYDAYDAVNQAEEALTPEIIIEFCIDANRISMYVDGQAGRVAEELVRSLIRDHGHETVVKFLAREFPMC